MSYIYIYIYYQKSGEPIRLADHMVRIAIPKRTLESRILQAYNYPNEVSFNIGLQQSRHCTCNTANFP